MLNHSSGMENTLLGNLLEKYTIKMTNNIHQKKNAFISLLLSYGGEGMSENCYKVAM